MTLHIGQAVSALGVQGFSIDGNPTSEDEFNKAFKKSVGVDSTGSAIMSTDPSTFGVTWTQVKTKYDELVSTIEPMRLLREERDIRIKETDWRASSDLTISNAWKTYRQALRDLPASSTPKLDSNGDLDISSVTWPTPPS